MVLSEEKTRDPPALTVKQPCALFNYHIPKGGVMGQHPCLLWVYDLQECKLNGWMWRGLPSDNCWAEGQPDPWQDRCEET